MWKGDKGTKFICETVGDLKAALENVPDDYPLECGLDSAVKIQVFTNMDDPEERHLSIEGYDDF